MNTRLDAFSKSGIYFKNPWAAQTRLAQWERHFSQPAKFPAPLPAPPDSEANKLDQAFFFILDKLVAALLKFSQQHLIEKGSGVANALIIHKPSPCIATIIYRLFTDAGDKAGGESSIHRSISTTGLFPDPLTSLIYFSAYSAIEAKVIADSNSCIGKSVSAYGQKFKNLGSHRVALIGIAKPILKHNKKSPDKSEDSRFDR